MGEHADKTKGKIKQVLGKVTKNEKLQREGKRDEAKGRIEGAASDAKDAAKNTKASFDARDAAKNAKTSFDAKDATKNAKTSFKTGKS